MKNNVINYVVKAQGYGGGGPSVPPFVSSNKEEISQYIADLINSDHAVQLYRTSSNEEGKLIAVEFDALTGTIVSF